MITGLDHVQVAAPPGCEAEARGFYGRLLGLPELQKPEPLKARGGAWFACGSQQLHVGVANDFTPATKAHPALITDNLDALAERLTAAGVHVQWDLDLPRPKRSDDRGGVEGTSRFFVQDPWGNRLELLTIGGHPTPAR